MSRFPRRSLIFFAGVPNWVGPTTADRSPHMPQIDHTGSSDPSLGTRILSMLVLGLAYSLAETVLIVLVIGQVLVRLVTGAGSEPLRRVGRQLADYLYRIFLYLTFNSDYRPFPFAAWEDLNAPRLQGPAASGE